MQYVAIATGAITNEGPTTPKNPVQFKNVQSLKFREDCKIATNLVHGKSCNRMLVRSCDLQDI